MTSITVSETHPNLAPSTSVKTEYEVSKGPKSASTGIYCFLIIQLNCINTLKTYHEV